MSPPDSDTPTAPFAASYPPTAAFEPDSAATVSPTDGVGTSPRSNRTAERFVLSDLIARGGMGVVYRATDSELDRTVAVKVLADELTGNPIAIRRFLNEAQLCGRLQHPGIVPVYALGELPDGRPFFAMKLVQGRTLEELLAERPAPSAELPRLLQIFEQICQAVGYAHSRGVIHRDLKPHNVMVGEFAEVQVMVWGLAREMRKSEVGTPNDGREPVDESSTPHSAFLTPHLTAAGTVMGTPAFMPPEQAAGDPDRMDRRADVFGLGAVLCVVLTGKPPYPPSDTKKAVAMAAAGDLTDAYARLDGCGADADLIALCKRCLSSRADGRPADAGAVANAVAAHRVGVEERARRAELDRATADARTVAERRRRKAQFGTTVAAALVLLLAAGVAWWVWADRERKEVAAKQQLAARDAEARVALKEAWEARKAGWLAGKDPAVWGERLAVARQALDRLDRIRADGGLSDAVEAEAVAARAEVEEDDKERHFIERLEAWNLKVETTGTLFTEKQVAADFSAFYQTLFSEFGLDPTAGTFQQRGETLRDRSAANDRAFGRPTHFQRPVLDPVLDALDHWLMLMIEIGTLPFELFEAVGQLAHGLKEQSREEMAEAILGQRADEWFRTATPRMYRAAANAHLDGLESLILELRIRRKLLERDPTDFRANQELGLLLMLSRDNLPQRPEYQQSIQEAARLFVAATVARPTDSRGHLELAKCLTELGDRTASEAAFRRAVAVASDGFDERLEYATFLCHDHRTDEAAALFVEAIEIAVRPDQRIYKPIRRDPARFLTMEVAFRGSLTARLAVHRAHVRFDPTPLNRVWLADILRRTGYEVEAATVYESILAGVKPLPKGGYPMPHVVGSFLCLAKACCAVGRYTEAEAALTSYRRYVGVEKDHLQEEFAKKVSEQLARDRAADKKLNELVAGGIPTELPADRDLARAAYQARRVVLAATALVNYLGQIPAHRLEDEELRAIIRAGTTGGADAARFTAEHRDSWREVARTHLRRQLQECKAGFYTGGMGVRVPLSDNFIASITGSWLAYPEFVGVRDETELKKLPAEEQAEWRRLWDQVREVQLAAMKRHHKVPPDTLPPAK